MAYVLAPAGSILGARLQFTRRIQAIEYQAQAPRTASWAITFEPEAWERSDWRYREENRLSDGAYLPLPWAPLVYSSPRSVEQYERRHTTDRDLGLYAHLSLKTPGMIAYTPSEEKGFNDLQATMRPGKFLQKYYPDMLTATERDAFIANVSTRTTLPKMAIARTTADVVTVYGSVLSVEIGSCMQAKASCSYSWAADLRAGRLPCHPAAVYGDSDLGVAYLGPITDITARCIVWPDKQIYGRLYGRGGYDNQLAAVLDALGYRKGSMDGARVRLIEDENGRIVMPYVDGIDGAEVDGQWIVLGSGDVSTTETCGWASEAEDETGDCADCGDTTDQSELDDHGGYCCSCDENNTSCDDCGSRVSCDETTELDGEYLCRGCYRQASSVCAIDGCTERFHESGFTRRTQQDRANRCVTALCEECGDSHDYCSNADAYYLQDDGCDCSECRPDDDDDTDVTLDVAPIVSVDPGPIHFGPAPVCTCTDCLARANGGAL